MKIATLKRRLRRNLIVPVLAAGVFFALGAPAVAGPVGAVGDVYVSSSQTGGGILQYDGVTGDFVGRFARGPTYGTLVDQSWGPDGNLYATAFYGYGYWEVFKFDGNTGAQLGGPVISYLGGGASTGKGIEFGPDGDLYVGDWGLADVSRYNGTTFALETVYDGGSGDNLGSPNGIEFGPNGNLMVISGGFNRVLAFDTSGGGLALLGTFAGPYTAIQANDLTYGPNGHLFVSGGTSGGVMEFDGTGDFIGWFVPENPGLVTKGLVFDDYNRLLVSSGSGTTGRVIAYNATTGALLGDFFPAASGGMLVPTYMTIKVPEPAAFTTLLVGGVLLAARRRG